MNIAWFSTMRKYGTVSPIARKVLSGRKIEKVNTLNENSIA